MIPNFRVTNLLLYKCKVYGLLQLYYLPSTIFDTLKFIKGNKKYLEVLAAWKESQN